MKRALLWAGGVVLVLVVAAAGYLWSCYAPMMAGQRVAVDGQLTVLLGGGGNAAVLVAKDKSRVVVIDTKMRPAALRLRAFIDSVAPGAKVTIINTHNHADHAAGNADILYRDAIAGAYTNEQWHARAVHAPVPGTRIAPDEGRVLRLDDELIEVRNMGVAHTRNDVIVYLHNRRLLLAVQRDYLGLIRGALDDPAALAQTRRLFAGYRGLPGMSGFGRTVACMRAER